MSTHRDSTKDEYLEVEKKVGAAEYELAANLAETDKALDTAMKRARKTPRRHASSSSKRSTRSDLSALPELLHAQSLSHR